MSRIKVETKGPKNNNITKTNSDERKVYYSQIDLQTEDQFIRLYFTPFSDSNNIALEVYKWDGSDYDINYTNGKRLEILIGNGLTLDKDELINLFSDLIQDLKDM